MKNSENPKILYVGSPPLFTKGASAIHMMKMCQAMKGMGLNVELIFPDYDKSRDIFEYYGIKEKFKIKTIPFTNIPGRQGVHGLASSIYCLFKKGSFDIVITRNIVFAYIATKWFGIPTIYDAHHPLVNGGARWMFNGFKNSDNLKRFTTNSKGLAEIYLKEGLDEKKLVVAHNGVDLENFKISETKEQLRKDLGIPEDKLIICYCGNTYKGRGIELLISAAENYKNFYFLVVGGLREDNERYEKTVNSKKISNFELKGFVSHSLVPKYLLASDILVIPYTNEVTIKGGTNASRFTSPIKLFEYMAAGKPILSSELPTILEILEDGKTASLFEPGNSDSFCEKLDNLLDNPEYMSTLSKNASNKVEEYTWEARVKKLIKIPFL